LHGVVEFGGSAGFFSEDVVDAFEGSFEHQGCLAGGGVARYARLEGRSQAHGRLCERQRIKVFWFFFSKKNRFLAFFIYNSCRRIPLGVSA
jgi:hypothetical protein